jgi:Amt family ammonium transporter
MPDCPTPAGWLFTYGAIDFAGGMVIHVSSGVSALVLTTWLGGRWKPQMERPHNVPFVVLGAALLWFGWFGFNAGSAVSAGA